MATADHNIVIGLGVKDVGVKKGLEGAEQAVKDLDKAMERLSEQFHKQAITQKEYSSAMSKLEKSKNSYAKSISNATTGVNKLSKATKANAIPATQELSRVFQDMPYGIQGVANNIQQLTAQFGYLSAKSGGAVAAAKAMFASLAGPAGILMAVSLVTTALVSFGPEIKAFITGQENAEEKTKRFKKQLEDQKKAHDELRKSIKKTADTQRTALALMGKLFGDATDDIYEQQRAVDELRVSQLKSALNDQNKIIRDSYNEGEDIIKKVNSRIFGNIKSSEEDRIEELKQINKAASEEKVRLQEDLSTTLQSLENNDLQETIRRRADDTSNYKTELDNQEELYKDWLKKRKEAYASNRTFGDTPSFSGMGAGTFDNRGGNMFSGMFSGMMDDVETPDFVANAGSDIVDAVDTTNANLEIASQDTINIGNTIASSFADFGASWGEALASGKGFVDNAGIILISAVGDILVALGRATIAAGIGMIALKKVFANPLGAIVAGTAMVAIGSMLKGKMQQITSGIGGGGSSSSVGGGGSSSFRGSSSSAVSSGGGGGTYIFEIEGTKLVGVLSRTLNRNKALGGSLSLA